MAAINQTPPGSTSLRIRTNKGLAHAHVLRRTHSVERFSLHLGDILYDYSKTALPKPPWRFCSI
jgi:hypothetical protein